MAFLRVLDGWSLKLLLALVASTCIGNWAQSQSLPAPTILEQTVAAPAAKPSGPTAVPLPEIVTQAEATAAELREIAADAATERTIRSISAELALITREINTRAPESAKILAQRPSVETLSNLERGWQRLAQTLETRTSDLARSIGRLDQTLQQLAALEGTWLETSKSARVAESPPEVIRRIDSLIAMLARTRDEVERRRTQVLTVQSRVASQSLRAADAMAALNLARDQMVARLLEKDSPAIWSAGLVLGATANWDEEVEQSLALQFDTLHAYAQLLSGRFLLHGAVFVLLALAFYGIRGAIRRKNHGEPDMQRAALVFATPVATSLVIALFASRWLYPEAPRLLWAMVGVAALVPTVFILRRLVAPHLRPILYAVLALFLVDQLRAVLAAVDLVPRLLFLAEMAAGVLFLIWFLRFLRSSAQPSSTVRADKTIRIVVYVALAFFLATGIANAMGYVSLANLTGNAVLGSAFLGVLLYTLVTILEALVSLALRSRPLALLGMVRRHSELLRQRVHAVLKWAAIALWTLFALGRLSLRSEVVDTAQSIFLAKLSLGSISISLADILLFAGTIWGAFLVSRLVQFVLDEDIYPRARLKRGLPYAISKTLHYVILVAGFLMAVAALGFDMTKFTILAGAFTVGVGFGLQNIFNNFVSGLILLFERPVQVGDLIQLDDATGVVERIGIRASVVRGHNGSEIIVPNGKLISDKLVNWTFSSRLRGIEIPVAVAHGPDPRVVIETLVRVAAENPSVSKEPAPQARLDRLGPDWLGFELRVWTDKLEQWMDVRSEVAVAASVALSAEKIALK